MVKNCYSSRGIEGKTNVDVPKRRENSVGAVQKREEYEVGTNRIFGEYLSEIF